MNLIINHTSMEPIYEQIMAQIKAEVIEGTLTAGDALPSVRALSRELKISALTVKKAYDILDSKGIIITKSTKGTFITEDIINAKNDRTQELYDDLNNIIAELKNYGFTIDGGASQGTGERAGRSGT